MTARQPIDVQFSREDLCRKGARDRLCNPTIVDDAFDSLLARLQSNKSEPSNRQSTRRLPIFRQCARRLFTQKQKA